MRIVIALALAGCAAHEELPLETPAPHGYSHRAKAKPDPYAADRVAASAELDAETAREADRSKVDPVPATTVTIAKPPPAADRPDPWQEHVKACKASVSDRTSKALVSLRDFDQSKATISAKCKTLEPKCFFSGDRHVIGCKGITPDDASFVESVCAILPQVVAIDESKECVDVDKPELVVHYGDGSAADVKARWLAVLKGN